MVKSQNIITRQCALTRENRPTEELIRFAVGPDDILVPDIDAKAPGRGVWISLDFELVQQAEIKNIFAKSLKAQVKPAQDLANLTKTRLEQRLTGALGLARKAGQLVLGATKVRSALASMSVMSIFTATDAAPDGRRKIAQAIRAAPNGENIGHFDLLNVAQMSAAVGGLNVIHAALLDSPAGKSARVRAERLAQYMDASGQKETAN